MHLFSNSLREARSRNEKAIAAFGVRVAESGTTLRVIRQGGKVALYTVGYEKRDGDELVSLLVDQGVKALADVREKPISRKPDFRAGSLKALCEEAGIDYQPWPTLGSTERQREALQESGDFASFAKDFRSYAKRKVGADLDRLAKSVRKKPTALLCYERDHFDCHRSILAELIGDQLDATVIAL